MGNSIEYISCNCVLFSYSQGRAECEALLPPFLQNGSNWGGTNFSSQYHGEFHG